MPCLLETAHWEGAGGNLERHPGFHGEGQPTARLRGVGRENET